MCIRDRLKGYACRELTRVADLAMSIYAAIGYTKEMRIGRIWADLRGNEMGGGTTEVMEYIAGRQLAKKYKACLLYTSSTRAE